jgi:hypothetical protein
MTGRILSVLVAFILALNIGTAAVAVAAAEDINLVYAYAKATASDPKAQWHVIGSGCSLTEPGATTLRVRCRSLDQGEPGDEPSYPLPPMDTWHAPVAILDAP